MSTKAIEPVRVWMDPQTGAVEGETDDYTPPAHFRPVAIVPIPEGGETRAMWQCGDPPILMCDDAKRLRLIESDVWLPSDFRPVWVTDREVGE